MTNPQEPRSAEAPPRETQSEELTAAEAELQLGALREPRSDAESEIQPEIPPDRVASDAGRPLAAVDADPSATSERSASKANRGAEPRAATVASPLRHLQEYATPLGVLLVVLVVLGSYLRLRDFGYPKTLQFDEHHFVETARGYLKHQADWNDHPPLGKLLIAASIKQIGDTSIAFRLPALISGLLTIVLGALGARRLFASKWAAFMGAALLSADGFLIAYSRAALLDGFLATASIAALLMVSYEVTWLWGCLSGLILGFAVSVKFSGIGVILPLLFAVAVAKRQGRDQLMAVTALAFTAAAVYVSSYSLGLSLTDKPHAIGDVLDDTQRLFKHHAELTDMKNPATSGWVTWFLPTRPLMLGFFEKHGSIRALTTLGNLAIWWGAVLLALLASASLLKMGWSNALRGSTALAANHGPKPAQSLASELDANPGASSAVNSFVVEHGQAVVAALLTAIGFLAPWVMTHRDSYIYHFLPVYAPLVVTLAGFSSWYEQKRPQLVFYFVVVTLLVAAFYAPLWAYVPMSPDALRLRLFIASWR